MNKYFLAIGSNFSDRKKRVADAISWLGLRLGHFCVSDIYETLSTSGDGTVYANAVACGECDLDAQELQKLCKEYEDIAGRNHDNLKLVSIDIDVVSCNSEILRLKDFYREYFSVGYRQIKGEDQGR